MAVINALSEELYPVGTDIVTKYIGRDAEGYANFTEGKTINSNTGEYIDSSNNAASDVYIPISPYYTYQKSANRLYNGTWYDENHNRISSFNLNNLQVQLLPKAPDNARYFRFASHPTAKANWKITITRIPVTSHTLQEARRRILLNTPHLETISDSIASFKTDLAAPVKDCKVYFTPVQEGSGDPSPDNVRPISGWDGVEISIGGRNLIHSGIEWFPTKIEPASGKIQGSVYNTFYFPVPKGQIHFHKKGTAFAYGVFTDEPPTIGTTCYGQLGLTNYYDRIFDNSAGHKYLVLFGPTGTINKTVYDFCAENDAYVGIEPWTAVKTYPPDVPASSLTIPFPQTIYGGYVDLVKGEVVEEWDYGDMDRFEWKYDSSVKRFESPSLDRALRTARQVTCLSDIYNAISNVTGGYFNANAPDKSMCFNTISARPYLILKDSNYTDAASFKASLSGHELGYKRVSPITYQLTPETIKTLRGINNIWSDANGNIEVKFWKH